MRISKPFIAAALAISMAGTPVLAQSAAPLSVARSGASTTHASQQFDNPRFLPALVIIAILAAAILLTRHHHPASP
jgi:hypothetical protein